MTNPTQPAEGMPERWQLVPVEPTSDMCFAMSECDGYHRDDRDHPGPVRWEDYWRMAISAAPKAPPMPDDVYGAMLSTIGAASMYLSREQMKPFIDWLKAQGFTKE